MSLTPDSFGTYPSPDSVAEQLQCGSRLCSSPKGCWTDGFCRNRHRPDTREAPRIRDPKALQRKLLSDRECWSCGGPASDGHHLLYRAQGGDDVEDNIVPLCHHCHMLHHSGVGADAQLVRDQLAVKLVRDGEREINYLIRKLGFDPASAYLMRVYGVGLGGSKL